MFKNHSGTSLVVQWLRLCPPNAGSPGSIPGRGTRSCTLKLRARVPQRRPITAKYINKYFKKRESFIYSASKKGNNGVLMLLVLIKDIRYMEDLLGNLQPRILFILLWWRILLCYLLFSFVIWALKMRVLNDWVLTYKMWVLKHCLFYWCTLMSLVEFMGLFYPPSKLPL